jgi:hypothetical protein
MLSRVRPFFRGGRNPDKTRFVDFRSYRPDGKDHPDTDGTSVTFLGFCHVWGKSWRGKTLCGK